MVERADMNRLSIVSAIGHRLQMLVLLVLVVLGPMLVSADTAQYFGSSPK